jgi:hypothetical protein
VTAQKRLSGYEMDILNPFHSTDETAKRIDRTPGDYFLNCRYFAEKMISGIGAHRRFASVSTKIGIGKERFRSRVDSGELKFLAKDTRVCVCVCVWVTRCFIFRYHLLKSFAVRPIYPCISLFFSVLPVFFFLSQICRNAKFGELSSGGERERQTRVCE